MHAEIEASERCFESVGAGLFGGRSKGDKRLVVFCGYRYFHEPPELQMLYGVDPRLWGRGSATEAAREMIRFGFESLGFSRIVASCDAPNAASIRVMEKAGMQFEKRVTINGLDTIYYELPFEEFRAS